MKIDHLVINIDDKYQLSNNIIEEIRKKGFPYEPKWGKGTKGFKASNIWIGNEYFEMIRLLKKDGGGWKPEWVSHYNNGHRGLICLMIDVDNVDLEYQRIVNKGICITEPKYLQFKWFFNLFTRTMPWRNSYIDFFEGVPMQIGFQQMKDWKALDFMHKYMVPNSKDNGINGITKIIIKGDFVKADFDLIQKIFKITEPKNDTIFVTLSNNQQLFFKKSNSFSAEVYTYGNNKILYGSNIEIESVKVFNT
jgi:hypothetical protein